MKRFKGFNVEKNWSIFAGTSSIVAHLIMLGVDLGIDKARSVFWLFYLLFFWFIPVVFMGTLEGFISKNFKSHLETIKTLRVNLQNSSMGVDSEISERMLCNKNDAGKFEYSGLFNRAAAFYFIGTIGVLVFMILVKWNG